MKKSDFVVGNYYKFTSNGYVADQTNNYDQFLAYFYCKEDSLEGLLSKFNSRHNSLVNRRGVPYGTILPNFDELKGTLVRCVSIANPSSANTRDEPFFNVLDEFGNATPHFYVVSSGRYLEPVEAPVYVNKTSLTERGKRANKLEAENSILFNKIVALEQQLKSLKEQHERNIYTVDALRKYDTDEDALAALFVEAISTGADMDKMKELMKKTGVTAKL